MLPYKVNASDSSSSFSVFYIAAAGNALIDIMAYPASYPGVISVASSNGRDEIVSFSTRNRLISVAAPGQDVLFLDGIVKLFPAGGGITTYIVSSGTSMVAAFVTGVVALIKQKFSTATPAQIKEILETTALDIDIPGFDTASGHGRVRPKEALATTTLPAVSWTEVEFNITYESKGLEFYVITLLDSMEMPIYSIMTNSAGKAYSSLPEGDYSFFGNYLGEKYSDTFTLGTTQQVIQHDYTQDDFADYYTVSTYDATVENAITLYETDDKGNPTTWVGTSKNISSSNSEPVFKVRKDVIGYLVTASAVTTGAKGNYNIVMEKGVYKDVRNGYLGELNKNDVTNATTVPEENVSLRNGIRLMRYLAQDDVDYFKLDFSDVYTLQSKTVLTDHTGSVEAVKLSSNGKKMISASADKTIKVWNTTTWALERTLTGHTDGVRSIMWNNDGSRLASASLDTTVKIWNTETWNLERTLTDHSDIITQVAWHPSENLLASGGAGIDTENTIVRIWSTDTWKELTTYNIYPVVSGMSWNAAGTKLAVWTFGYIRILDLDTVTLTQNTSTPHSDFVTTFSWSADETYLVSGGQDTTIRVWTNSLVTYAYRS